MRCRLLSAALLYAFAATPSLASLAVGSHAPDFTVQGRRGGEGSILHLAELLKTGPVIIFFMPTVFTGSSAGECHAFADAADRFGAVGATLIGMTRDSLDQLAEFSKKECDGKVPMASADMDIVTGFDVNDSANFTTTTTYVIAPDGKVVSVDNDDEQSGHARRALVFVQGMKR